MVKRLFFWLNSDLIFRLALPVTSVIILSSTELAIAQSYMYSPVPLAIDQEIADTLSQQDIPSGQGGFYRDYSASLKQGEQILIEVKSKSFDTIVSLIARGGTTIGENDDGPDGTTNSLLFARIVKSGNYIIRVRSFSDKASVGPFTIKVTRLRGGEKR